MRNVLRFLSPRLALSLAPPLLASAVGLGCGSRHLCSCDADIHAAGPGSFEPGGGGDLQLFVTYSGAPECGGGALCVVESLPAGLSCDPSDPAYSHGGASTPWGCSCDGHEVRCCYDEDLPDVRVGLPPFTAPVRIDPGISGASVTTCARIEQGFSGAFADTDASNNESCVTTPVGARPPTPHVVTRANKVDLLFAIDNSRSMGDKQAVFAESVSELVKGLVNPPCLDDAGAPVAPGPQGPLDACPPGSARALQPVVDLHIGVVSSSLGGHGSDSCALKPSNPSLDDRGHLIWRKTSDGANNLPTYKDQGFLAWDPAQRLDPPGEADLDMDSGGDGGDSNSDALIPVLKDMVIGVGQIGCGYESQMESWYRFLVDPEPRESISLDNSGQVVLSGTDTLLLEQRKAFLRPDSLLAIVMLSDEDDCSIREEGQYYYAAQQKAPDGSPFHLPKARAICDKDPNDECCFSCGQIGPLDANGQPICKADPSCIGEDGKTAYLDETTDNINLRCWDQKRRFGIDFLYGLDRYEQGLQSPMITSREGAVVENPLFRSTDDQGAPIDRRDPSLVVLLGMVGVPWQDIARMKDGKLERFLTAEEMAAPVSASLGYNRWDLILGDPDRYAVEPDAALPHDRFMIASVDPRTGTNPITGDDLGSVTNSINGRERTISKRDDLQYACIFKLSEDRDCSTPGMYAGCDCEDINNDNPLCEVNPATGNPTDQVRAKAYPGLRHLGLLKRLGHQGVTTSICPVQMTDPGATDFAYRPAARALLDRMAPRLY